MLKQMVFKIIMQKVQLQHSHRWSTTLTENKVRLFFPFTWMTNIPSLGIQIPWGRIWRPKNLLKSQFDPISDGWFQQVTYVLVGFIYMILNTSVEFLYMQLPLPGTSLLILVPIFSTLSTPPHSLRFLILSGGTFPLCSPRFLNTAPL